MIKKTKIIATLSDQQSNEEFLKNLFDNGVNVVRINSAHQDIEGAVGLVDSIRKTNDRIAILIDTKGPEVRTSPYGQLEIKKNQFVYIVGNPKEETKGDTIYVTFSEIHKYLSKGDSILIDDGEIELEITGIIGNKIECLVLTDGIVKPKKGVNTPNIDLPLPAVSEKDKTFIEFAIRNRLDFIAHSFVQRASDVIEIKKIIEEADSPIKVIAKIENKSGVDNIESIIEVSDGIMVARGDLGIEIAAEKIPIIQQEIVQKCIKQKKPVIIATQMLHSMITNHRPTRAEISDVATAIFERADAIMLSGETAYGKYPIEAVKTMTRVAIEIENTLKHLPFPEEEIEPTITSTLCKAAIMTASMHDIKTIIADTTSGRTCRYLSALRGQNEIFAMCYDSTVMRQLNLSFGVIAFNISTTKSRDRFLRDAIKNVVKKKDINKEDKVLILGGSFGRDHGATFIEIATPEQILKSPCE